MSISDTPQEAGHKAMRQRIDHLNAENERLRAALIRARGFIQNGIALGYIRMPDPDTPDTAHEVPGIIDAALK
jgi:hypothetical protein